MKLFWLNEVLIGLSILLNSTGLSAHNPIIKGEGVCDTHIHIFNNVAYLFSSHDYKPNSNQWDMRDWQVYSSTDLINWKKEFVLKPENTYAGLGLTHCFATDGATRNGKYYFYFSNGQESTGVARSNLPGGTYIDALNGPLVKGVYYYDPTIFIDDDKNQTPYLIWGAINFRIALLNTDMISLAEPEHIVDLIDFTDVHDGSYMHKKNGIYYFTSQSGYYGMGNNVYGPFTYVEKISPFGTDDFVDHPTFFQLEWSGLFRRK